MNIYLQESADQYYQMIAEHDLHTLEFTDFGSDEIKKMGFSPDTFV